MNGCLFSQDELAGLGHAQAIDHPLVPDRDFASSLHERKRRDNFVSQAAFDKYLADNPHNESRFFFPFDDDAWQDPEDSEIVASGTGETSLRGRKLAWREPGASTRP